VNLKLEWYCARYGVTSECGEEEKEHLEVTIQQAEELVSQGLKQAGGMLEEINHLYRRLSTVHSPPDLLTPDEREEYKAEQKRIMETYQDHLSRFNQEFTLYEEHKDSQAHDITENYKQWKRNFIEAVWEAGFAPGELELFSRRVMKAAHRISENGAGNKGENSERHTGPETQAAIENYFGATSQEILAGYDLVKKGWGLLEDVIRNRGVQRQQ
jgi:hypothetical protein